MSNDITFEFKLLGTGTSTGVPTISCQCSTCTSDDPKDNRLRCSALISFNDKNIIIDTGPDFRQQMINNKVKVLNAAVYTHHHFDHIGGFDDIRGINFASYESLNIYLNQETYNNLSNIFAYAFQQISESNTSVPLVNVNIIKDNSFEIEGLRFVVLPLMHGNLQVLGFRIGNIAYCTDTNYIPQETIELMQDLDFLVLDGLREKQHKTHFNIDQAIQVAQKINAKQTYLTHIAHQTKHLEIDSILPERINLAYDGLTLKGKYND